MKRLHLGCGERYLEGYINIDFPLTEHSVQKKSVADEYHDIKLLQYPSGSINEIRLHHVFEHFDRPTACALIASWNSWLPIDGVLHIEVPDFERTAKIALSHFTKKAIKKVAIRHIFGSHEAAWAIHAEGYGEWMVNDILGAFGFIVNKVKKNKWKNTYNIEVFALKKYSFNLDQLYIRAQTYLKDFLVDESEKHLLDVWMSIFRKQLERSYAK